MAGMHIPEHINVKGQPINTPAANNNRVVTDRDRVMELMNVPDRIVLVGGDKFMGYSAIPVDTSGLIREEHTADLKELPDHLTLADESPYPDEPTSMEEARSTSSIAIDENPLQELKLMRRQMGRINTRLYQLEDEMETRRLREKQLFFTTVVGLAAAILSIFLRR